MTTYVSRHSWATIADKEGIDRRIISKGLGHNDLKTTEIYIDDIVSEESLLEADLKIINSISVKPSALFKDIIRPFLLDDSETLIEK